ncbi:MAG: GIY-YIG nuclease family protein [Bacteroidota bacterium]
MAYKHKYYFVYLLKCADNSFYTGITNNIERRLSEHETGRNPGCYTFFRRPVELVYSEYFYDPDQAIAFEKKVKGWAMAKKEALINHNWDKIKFLSECQNLTHFRNKNKEINTEI